MFEIDIDGFIGADFWEEGVTEKFIKNKLKDAKGQPVQFNINSPGGYVVDGLGIFNLIKNYEGKTKSVITGLAASMASVIALACDEVVAESNAMYMIHNPLNFAIGDYQVMQENADFLKRMALHLSNEYVGKTGKDQSEINKMMDNESWFFGQEILDAGFIDELLPPKNQKKDGENSQAKLPGIDGDVEDYENSKDSNLINAQTQFESMKKEMAKHTVNIDDIREAAAMLPIINEKNPEDKELTEPIDNIKITNIENKKGESNIMNLEQLKSENIELFNQINSEAVDGERKRVSALLKFVDSAKDSVIEAIKKGTEMSDPELQAELLQASAKANFVKNAEEDNPDKVDSDKEATPKTTPDGEDADKDKEDDMNDDSEEAVDAFLGKLNNK